VADDSVALQRVLDDLRDQKARFTLTIIDACRENPFKGAGRGLSRRGLAPVTAATGQMVLYSAGAGQEALDRLGPHDADPNGVFTRVFIREIKKPGVPALYDQSIGEFYFIAKGPAVAAAPPDFRHVETAEEREQSFWDRIKDSNDPADFSDYKNADGSQSAWREYLVLGDSRQRHLRVLVHRTGRRRTAQRNAAGGRRKMGDEFAQLGGRGYLPCAQRQHLGRQRPAGHRLLAPPTLVSEGFAKRCQWTRSVSAPRARSTAVRNVVMHHSLMPSHRAAIAFASSSDTSATL
jgi:hypothetical protein